ncbi:MAG: hypothetical protein ABFD13_05785 [Candidatus Cryosericum sp.]
MTTVVASLMGTVHDGRMDKRAAAFLFNAVWAVRDKREDSIED